MLPLKIKTSYDVQFSPDGSHCLTIGSSVSLWDIQARRKAWTSRPLSNPSYGVFSPDGSLIAVKNTAGRIATLDPETGSVIRDFRNQKEGEGTNLLFSNCGEYLVRGSVVEDPWLGLLIIRSVSSGQVKWRREFKGGGVFRVHSVRGGETWISEHSRLPTASDKPPGDHYFLKWTWPIWDSTPERLSATFPRLWASAFNKLGTAFAVTFSIPPQHKVRVSDEQPQGIPQTLSVYEAQSEGVRWSAEVTSGHEVSWSPCGRFLGCAQKERIAIYDASNGSVVARYAFPYACAVAFSPDSRLIACGSWGAGEIRDLEDDIKKQGEQGAASDAQTPRPSLVSSQPAAHTIQESGAPESLSVREVMERDQRGEYESEDEFDDALWLALCDVVKSPQSLAELPEPVWVYYVTRLLEWDVDNGGFSQAAMNMPDLFELAAKGNEILGKPQLAALIREASELASRESERIQKAREGDVESESAYFADDPFAEFDARLDDLGG